MFFPSPVIIFFFFLMMRRPPRSPLFPYTPLFRSMAAPGAGGVPVVRVPPARVELKPPPFGWFGGCSKVVPSRSEEHTSELQSLAYLVCRLLLEKKKNKIRHA